MKSVSISQIRVKQPQRCYVSPSIRAQIKTNVAHLHTEKINLVLNGTTRSIQQLNRFHNRASMLWQSEQPNQIDSDTMQKILSTKKTVARKKPVQKEKVEPEGLPEPRIPQPGEFKPITKEKPKKLDRSKLPKNALKITVKRGKWTEDDARGYFAEFSPTAMEVTPSKATLGFETARKMYEAYKKVLLNPLLNDKLVLEAAIYKETVEPVRSISHEEFEKVITEHLHSNRKLPIGGYKGKILVVNLDAEVQPAIDALLGGKKLEEIEEPIILGLDLEWRPPHRPGAYNRTCMLQLASNDTVALFRLNMLHQERVTVTKSYPPPDVPQQVRDILTSPKVLKVGVSVENDVNRLKKDFDVTVVGVKDILNIPLADRCKPHNLKSLTAMFLGFQISKWDRATNWESPFLTESQIQYAATDAWCSREVFVKMSEIPFTSEDEELGIPSILEQIQKAKQDAIAAAEAALEEEDNNNNNTESTEDQPEEQEANDKEK